LAHLKEILSPAKLRPVAVVDVLEGVANEMQPAAEAKGLDLEVRVLARPTLLVGRNHLRTLWTNLLDNAIKYTPAGSILVTLDEQDGQLVTAISDTGIGISTEEVARIFEEFYRSETAKAEVPLSTGLGLAIVNQIVKVYQGTIEVDSTPGKGSEFTITLPLTASDTQV
jgi:two-component system phosphate regulon sensor histidine kinase PhoR